MVTVQIPSLPFLVVSSNYICSASSTDVATGGRQLYIRKFPHPL